MQLLEAGADLYIKMCAELFIWQAKQPLMNLIILKKHWIDNDLIIIMQHRY